MTMTCAVVAVNEDARNIIGAALRSLGMEAIPSASVQDVVTALRTNPASGILLEVATSIKASPEEKEAIQMLTRLFPLAKCRVAGKEIVVFGKANSLDGFVNECRQFKPRTIRREPRKSIHLALQLSADERFEDAEKVVTLNISDSGCFVFSARAWNVGDRVWLRLFGHDVPVCGMVCSWQPWGNNQGMPGIGIKLDAECLPFNWGMGVLNGAKYHSFIPAEVEKIPLIKKQDPVRE
jgi:Tfp pilus assembly protein PilZ